MWHEETKLPRLCTRLVDGSTKVGCSLCDREPQHSNPLVVWYYTSAARDPKA
jgi:hypothetical protein